MRRDSRLSVALHMLLHMSERSEPFTSEVLAGMLHGNPAVVRRTMAGLRDAGIVRSEKGHGGGWSLARPLEQVALADVYAALGSPSVFRIGNHDETPRCLLERAVNTSVGGALEAAEAMLLQRLRGVSVAEVLTEARTKHAALNLGRKAKPTKKDREHA